MISTMFLGRSFIMSTSICEMMGFTLVLRQQWIYFSDSIQINLRTLLTLCPLQSLNIFQIPMPKFNLKSGKDLFDVEQAADETYEDFQAKVFALTDIPPKNLKVLFKGKMIKDNQSLKGIPDGSQLIIMGTKSGQELKQTGDIKIDTFMIDENKKVERFGLQNIGNTCYMNASIQFLKSVPKINQLVRNIKPAPNNQSPQQVIGNLLSGVFKQNDKKDVAPKMFVIMFLNNHPEFTPFGTQQDADEFMQKLIQDISSINPEYAKVLHGEFELQIQTTLKNTEIPEEQPQVNMHTTTKLTCNLGGNDKQTKIGTMLEGIKYGLRTQIEKKSPIDNVNHIYSSESKINSLPSYLIVQMIRFFWKEVNDPNNQHNKPLAAKICRAIDFGGRIDLFDYCTEELKQKLRKGREAYEQNKKRDEEQYKKEFQAFKQSMKETNRPETRLAQEFQQKWKVNKKPLTEGLQTGVYQISAVVTHEGASVESGHYMAWVKDTEDEWIKYDDDTVYPQPEEKVFQLRGGQPNLEIAYLIMFRKVYTKPL